MDVLFSTRQDESLLFFSVVYYSLDTPREYLALLSVEVLDGDDGSGRKIEAAEERLR